MTEQFPDVPADVTDAFGDYIAIIAMTLAELCSPEPSLEPDIQVVKNRMRELAQQAIDRRAAHGTPLSASTADLLFHFQSVLEDTLDVAGN